MPVSSKMNKHEGISSKLIIVLDPIYVLRKRNISNTHNCEQKSCLAIFRSFQSKKFFIKSAGWESFNPLTAKYVYLRFSSIVSFFQFLSHFMWVFEARSKFIPFYTEFWVNRARFLASPCTSFLLRSKPVQWNYQHFF